MKAGQQLDVILNYSSLYKLNPETLSQSSQATSTPTSAPTNVQATSVNNNGLPIKVSWTDTTSNEAGFHIYRSLEPLDLSKSQPPTQINSGLQWAYFKDLSPNQHYLAVKVRNSCGEGWSNYVSVDIPQSTVQGVTTTIWSTLKSIFQSFFSGLNTR